MGNISKKISLKDFVFELRKAVKGGREDIPFVCYAPSTGELFFNPTVVKDLQIEDWENVLVGYDKKNQIIVLQKCCPEEYGSVPIVPKKASGKHARYAERYSKTRVVNIKFIEKSCSFTIASRYVAENDGSRVFLEKALNS